MLDNYKDEQNIVYKIIKNTIKNNRCSHAYLIETNGYAKKNEFAVALAKYLLCKNKYTNNDKCQNCRQCENIDKNIISDLKIIYPEGLWIKKDQLKELQQDFKTKSLSNNKKVYIITDASKLNDSSANSILKFLEEPNEGITAILLADNVYTLIDTIVSRCQILKLNNLTENDNIKIDSFLSFKLENLDNYINNTINFINNIEQKKILAIIDSKKMFINNFIEKNEIITAFEIMILYYKEIVNIKLNRKNELFLNYKLDDIASINEIENLYKKIKIIMNYKKNIYINANTNLLIDKLILELGDVR